MFYGIPNAIHLHYAAPPVGCIRQTRHIFVGFVFPLWSIPGQPKSGKDSPCKHNSFYRFFLIVCAVFRLRNRFTGVAFAFLAALRDNNRPPDGRMATSTTHTKYACNTLAINALRTYPCRAPHARWLHDTIPVHCSTLLSTLLKFGFGENISYLCNEIRTSLNHHHHDPNFYYCLVHLGYQHILERYLMAVFLDYGQEITKVRSERQ